MVTVSILLFLVLYVWCGVAGYLRVRDYFRITFKSWTNSDRITGILMAMTGPLFFMVTLTMCTNKDSYRNREAKW